MAATILKRFRPRFSIRTLVVVVTLACCYAACWGPTKRKGVEDVNRRHVGIIQDTAPVLPLFVRRDDETLRSIRPGSFTRIYLGPRTTRRYYFWFFGYVAKLPWEREIVQQQASPDSVGQSGADMMNKMMEDAIRMAPSSPPGSSPESQ